MKHALLSAVVTTTVTLVTHPAFAHDDAYLDAQKAPNGGQLRMAGPLHYELVTASDAVASRESPVIVYVTDHAGAPVETAGAIGAATIVAGPSRSTAALAPDGGNRMRGIARYVRSPDLKVVVSITFSGGTTEQARFTP